MPLVDDVEVVFQPDGRRGKMKPGATILQAANRLGIDITSICGGGASCGKCVVRVDAEAGKVSEPTTKEKEVLGEEGLKKGYRLACGARVLGNLVVVVPDESRTGHQRLQVEGLRTYVDFEPLVRKQYVNLNEFTLGDDDSRADALLTVLQTEYGSRCQSYGHQALRKLPSALKEGGLCVTATILYEREIIDVEPHSTTDRIYGFAVDVGTTKMAGYLVDLNTGALVGVDSKMNPQIPFGEDIISRITYAMRGPEEHARLHDVLVEGVNEMLGEVCGETGARLHEVYEIVLVGNTAMHHFLMGLDPSPLARSPFTPTIRDPMDVWVSETGLKANPGGNVHVLPVIAGFVGADCVAGILATEVYKSDELCFLIDIGTNTEIVIGSQERMTACSCASGPAFEGAHIKDGMRAAIGAIEKAWIDPDTLELGYQTIDHAKPKGLCGSGLIDVLSGMLKAGVMDTSGRIRREVEHPRVRVQGGVPEFVVAWGGESATDREIVVSQLDIRELQKGKAAMYSGASILMGKLGITTGDIEKVFLAGAFGTYIDPVSAMEIGMIPDFPPAIISQVGNAAGTGARMSLISRAAREDAARIQGKVGYVELAADPDYNQAFMDALFFPHLDLGLFPRTMRKLGGRLREASIHRTLAKRRLS